jgi:tetratricopeptide (TPR) repeat protein
VACGAGFPPDTPPAAQVSFAVYLAAGMEDFNFPELQELNGTLDGLRVPHEFESFSGGHEWPPEKVCSHAVQWLELQAMKSGIRGKDASLIASICAETVAEAELLERDRRLNAALQRYAAAWRSFAGLRDTAALEMKVKQLEPAQDVRRARATEKNAGMRQRAADKELSSLFGDVIAGRDHPYSMQKLGNSIDRLRKDAERREDDPGRIAAVRVLSRFWIALNEETSIALERREYGSATRRLEAMARIRPENPQVHYHLARAYCLSGRKKDAIASLRNAVAKGYRDTANLENNPDLESLRTNPDFRKIIEDLERR